MYACMAGWKKGKRENSRKEDDKKEKRKLEFHQWVKVLTKLRFVPVGSDYLKLLECFLKQLAWEISVMCIKKMCFLLCEILLYKTHMKIKDGMELQEDKDMPLKWLGGLFKS